MSKQNNQNNFGGTKDHSKDQKDQSSSLGSSMSSSLNTSSNTASNMSSNTASSSASNPIGSSDTKGADRTESRGGAQRAGMGADGQVNTQGEDKGVIPQFLGQVQDNKQAMKYIRQVERYAEQNPTQTIIATTCLGAFVGWLLTSTRGKSALSSSFSFAAPMVNSWVAENITGSQHKGASVH